MHAATDTRPPEPGDELLLLEQRLHRVLSLLGLLATSAAMVVNELVGFADAVSRASGAVLVLAILPSLLARGPSRERFYRASLYFYLAILLAGWLHGFYVSYPAPFGEITIVSVSLWLPTVYALFFLSLPPGAALRAVAAAHVIFVLATVPHALRTRGGGDMLDGPVLTVMLALAHAALIFLMYGYARIARSLRQARSRERELVHLADHDPLTGLANRRMFEQRCAAAFERARAAGSRAALLYLDLDGFKPVNDRLGHQLGDRVLQVVATRLRSCLRDSDLLSRVGGDEFALLLPEADREAAAQVCERLFEALRGALEVEGNLVRVGVSIGVVVFPEDGPDVRALVRRADLAMYEAKSAGGGYRFGRAA